MPARPRHAAHGAAGRRPHSQARRALEQAGRAETADDPPEIGLGVLDLGSAGAGDESPDRPGRQVGAGKRGASGPDDREKAATRRGYGKLTISHDGFVLLNTVQSVFG